MTTTAKNIFELLKASETSRLVLAESCSGGMAAALLTQVPGISAYFCGSTVTYRESTKTAWLQVSQETIAMHSAESQQTTNAMAIEVLRKTPEATVSAAITGHLGPGANDEVDGIVFVSVAQRMDDNHQTVATARIALTSLTRKKRQIEAAECLLKSVEQVLRNQSG